MLTVCFLGYVTVSTSQNSLFYDMKEMDTINLNICIRTTVFLQTDGDYSENSFEITVKQLLPEQTLLPDYAK